MERLKLWEGKGNYAMKAHMLSQCCLCQFTEQRKENMSFEHSYLFLRTHLIPMAKRILFWKFNFVRHLQKILRRFQDSKCQNVASSHIKIIGENRKIKRRFISWSTASFSIDVTHLYFFHPEKPIFPDVCNSNSVMLKSSIFEDL